jgi:uncharacterized protein
MLRTALRLLAVSAMLPWWAGAQQSAPAEVSFPSGGATIHGKFFPAPGTGVKPTLLLVPGMPGNANDVAGMGGLLPAMGVNVMMFNPRGMWASEGSFSFVNTLEDIDAALGWLASDDARRRFRIDPARVTLGGHSFGGGMATVYAAKHTGVRRLISISGADCGEIVGALLAAPDAAAARKLVPSYIQIGADASAGYSPVHMIDFGAALDGMRKIGNIYKLQDAAPGLADRSILLVGGWEDATVTVDQTVLPFYRALKKAGAQDVTFLVYHSGHQFVSVSERLATDIQQWLSR